MPTLSLNQARSVLNARLSNVVIEGQVDLESCDVGPLRDAINEFDPALRPLLACIHGDGTLKRKIAQAVNELAGLAALGSSDAGGMPVDAQGIELLGRVGTPIRLHYTKPLEPKVKWGKDDWAVGRAEVHRSGQYVLSSVFCVGNRLEMHIANVVDGASHKAVEFDDSSEYILFGGEFLFVENRAQKTLTAMHWTGGELTELWTRDRIQGESDVEPNVLSVDGNTVVFICGNSLQQLSLDSGKLLNDDVSVDGWRPMPRRVVMNKATSMVYFDETNKSFHGHGASGKPTWNLVLPSDVRGRPHGTLGVSIAPTGSGGAWVHGVDAPSAGLKPNTLLQLKYDGTIDVAELMTVDGPPVELIKTFEDGSALCLSKDQRCWIVRPDGTLPLGGTHQAPNTLPIEHWIYAVKIDGNELYLVGKNAFYVVNSEGKFNFGLEPTGQPKKISLDAPDAKMIASHRDQHGNYYLVAQGKKEDSVQIVAIDRHGGSLYGTDDTGRAIARQIVRTSDMGARMQFVENTGAVYLVDRNWVYEVSNWGA